MCFDSCLELEIRRFSNSIFHVLLRRWTIKTNKNRLMPRLLLLYWFISVPLSPTVVFYVKGGVYEGVGGRRSWPWRGCGLILGFLSRTELRGNSKGFIKPVLTYLATRIRGRGLSSLYGRYQYSGDGHVTYPLGNMLPSIKKPVDWRLVPSYDFTFSCPLGNSSGVKAMQLSVMDLATQRYPHSKVLPRHTLMVFGEPCFCVEHGEANCKCSLGKAFPRDCCGFSRTCAFKGKERRVCLFFSLQECVLLLVFYRIFF